MVVGIRILEYWAKYLRGAANPQLQGTQTFLGIPREDQSVHVEGSKRPKNRVCRDSVLGIKTLFAVDTFYFSTLVGARDPA